MTTGSEFPPDKNHRMTPKARRTNGGCGGFGYPRSARRGAPIVFDPGIFVCRVLVLDQRQAAAIRDTLAQVLR